MLQHTRIIYSSFILLALLASGCLDAAPSDVGDQARPAGDTLQKAGNPDERPCNYSNESELISVNASAYHVEFSNNFDCWIIHEVTVTKDHFTQNRTNPFGNETVTIGFLDSETTYTYSVRITNGFGIFDSVTGSFESNAGHPFSESPNPLIAPGRGIIIAGETQCTLGFFVRDELFQDVYAVTAGHCLADYEPGTRVQLEDTGEEFASTVLWSFSGFESESEGNIYSGDLQNVDWGLVKLDPEYFSNSSPKMLTFGGPTRLGTTTVYAGDPVCIHSLFYLEEYNPQSQDQADARCGPGRGYSNPTALQGTRLIVNTYSSGGDSGAPMIHGVTGEPLGIHLGVSGLDGGTYAEPICKFLNDAEAHDIHLALVTTTEFTQPNWVLGQSSSTTIPGYATTYTCEESVRQRHA